MSPPPPLEEPYRSAALRSGSSRYFAWLFASPALRDPLLGALALLTEWLAIADPTTAPEVGHVKLGWWREELERLRAGRPVHPITRFLASLPGAASVDFARLEPTLGALDAEIAGVPLETGAQFERRAQALRAPTFALIEAFGDDPGGGAGATALLAGAEQRAAALAHHRRALHAGRIVFPLDELRAAGIDPQTLGAHTPAAPLRAYLAQMRAEALRRLAAVPESLPPAAGGSHRHLAVMAALERERLYAPGDGPIAAWRRPWIAWRAARRASS